LAHVACEEVFDQTAFCAAEGLEFDPSLAILGDFTCVDIVRDLAAKLEGVLATEILHVVYEIDYVVGPHQLGPGSPELAIEP
jgi:hypothetical protein